MRIGGTSRRAQRIGIIAAAWIMAFAAPLLWAGQQAGGGIQSGAQGVVLVATMPGAASMASLVSPVPQNLLEDGQTGEMLVLQQSWTLGRGETLDAQCQVVAGPQANAQLFTSRTQYLPSSFVSTASSLGSSQVQTFPLVTGFDPAKGSLTDAQILLVVHGIPGQSAPGGDSSVSVRITVVAL